MAARRPALDLETENLTGAIKVDAPHKFNGSRRFF